MRVKYSFLWENVKRRVLIMALCLGAAGLVFGGIKIFADKLGDDARVDENSLLTYYVTVNSDGIDWTGTESSDTQIVQETSGITKVTNVLPDGLTFEGFVTSSDGTFGAVQRDDEITMCAGKVIDDTNEEGIDAGVWNSDETEYTYHGLHYDANTRTVTFRTLGITAGCELTIGIITRTPTLPENVFRMDFYDTATFVDESLFGNSNTVHAYIQKDTLPGEYWASYRYDGVVPANAPALPPNSYYDTNNAQVAVAETPTLEGYTFEGWFWDYSPSAKRIPAAQSVSLPGRNLELYGEWVRDESVPEPDNTPSKYNVSYEIDGEKPSSFNIPATRSYYEGSSVVADSTKSGENFEGYTFSGWDTDDADLDDDASFTMPSRDVVLNGSFERETYTVEYAFVGDVKPENADSLLPASAEYNAGDAVEVAGAVTAEGYTFSGWYADPSFEMPARNVTIQGEWTKNKIEFTPDISIEITNPEDEYHKGDVVQFEILITNNQAFDLNDVWLEELLSDAYFTAGSGYSVERKTFAKIDVIPANGSIKVNAEFVIEKNTEANYTNTVKLIAADSSNSDYVLPEDWDNEVSVDFVSGIISDIPIDEGDGEEPEEDEDKAESPITFDGVIRAIISVAIFGGGLSICILILKKNRRGHVVYGYCAGIMVASSFAVAMVNGVQIFADNLEETPELNIYSQKLSYENGEAGSWDVNESATWTGVGEALLKIKVNSKKISDLHNKDVILVLDNSKWTMSAIDGTESDTERDLPAMDLMKRGASEFVTDLLSDGDSRVIVFPIWGNIESIMTDDADVALSQINSVVSSYDTGYNSYSAAYEKVLNYLDYYEQSEDRQLNIVFVADDHVASSSEIAKYEMVKAMAPNAMISGIGFGIRELLQTRYTSAASASENGVARFWYGLDGNLNPIGFYGTAENGLKKVSDYHENPYYAEYVAALIRSVDGSLAYSKFNIETTINTDDFDIRGIFGDVGDIEVADNKISWINEEQGLVSGAKYEMSVLLKAKDMSVEKHKLYRLNTSTTVETDATDIEADSASMQGGVVLMNGYELKFNINNGSTCELGNNVTGVYLAHQKIDFDESGVYCEGWVFDSFKSADDGLIYSTRNNEMPSADLELMATWYKIGVEVHMDGQIHSVAPAILKDGESFNRSLYNISSNRYTSLLMKADGCPQMYKDDAHRLSADNSPTAVYAWFTTGNGIYYDDPTTGQPGYYYSSGAVYYCTDANTIKLNEDSKGLFSGGSYTDSDNVYHEFRTSISMVDDSIEEWDASDVKNMDYMFASSKLGMKVLEKIGKWDTSGVESMNYMFYAASNFNAYNENALKGWDTSGVKSMRGLFASSWDTIDNVGGVSNWDVSNVEDMSNLISNASFSNMDIFKRWDVSGVKNLSYAFYGISRGNGVDLSAISDWDLANIENLSYAFFGSKLSDLSSLSGWNVSNANNFEGMFSSTSLSSNGTTGSLAAIGGWDVSNATNMRNMFNGSNVSDLSGLSDWTVSNVENFSGIFSNDSSLTSLAGLEDWNVSSAIDMSGLLRDDVNLTDINALSGWSEEVSSVTTLANAFRGISVSDLNALKDWDVSSLTNLSYAFCGAPEYISALGYSFSCDDIITSAKNVYQRGAYGGPRSLQGLEGWKDKTGNVTTIEGMLAGSAVTDLSPISEWDVTGVKTMEKAFMRLNMPNFSDLSEWQTSNLEDMEFTFAFSKATTLGGLEDWDVSKVTEMPRTFSDMYELTSLEALSDWQTDSLGSMSGTFSMHHKLASLHGLEDWNISGVDVFYRTFEGYSIYDPQYYTDWSKYCDTRLTDISAIGGWTFEAKLNTAERFFACNEDITSLSALSGWRLQLKWSITTFDRLFEGDSGIQSLSGLEHWFDDVDSTSNVVFQLAFMNMSRLRDISALASWTNSNVKVASIKMFMMNDRQITSLAPLENSFFKDCSNKQNAFDNIPTGVTRPSWY